MYQISAKSVASLRLVSSPGAATHGVTLFFSYKKPTTFFSRKLKSDDLFVSSPPPSPPSDVVSPLFFVNSVPKNYISFGCHPLDDVTRGGPPPAAP